ncbi:protein NLRC5-like isoform X1 [Megalobrama amblycephala]|uniref:protein NLRC5-like isoform X1 n=1 Tax=Megalobrama amblycephala TaxID=75352 RepID=UPI002014300A|nr:protein NLRC5-like isoform X1 [Megalobrama amblycephala]
MDSHCKLETIKLNNFELTEKSCSVLATVLSSKTILKELNLNNSCLLNSGVKQICEGLKNPVCELKILKLSDCSITEEGYKALASALRSNPSHLLELDLTGNDPGQSGVKELTDLLQDQNCQLKTIRFLKSPAAEEACEYLTGVLGKSPLLLTELDLSEDKLGALDGEKLSALLMDSHCKVEKMKLNNCELTKKSCSVLATVLSSKSILKELNLNNSRLLDSGVTQICEGLKNPVCELKILRLRDCGLTEESCSALATVLRSNSRLEELDISNNNLQDSGVKKLQKALENTNCTLKKLRLSDCSITEEGYKALASALKSNPSHLVELDLTGNDPGQSGVKELTDLLQDQNCQLKLRFLSPAADEAFQYVKGIVGKNPLLLRELNLRGCELGDTRVNQIAALLQDKHCQLTTLILCRCSITQKMCLLLTSALKSNPSHLRELNLSGNKLGDSGVKHLRDILKDSHCKLERLRLTCCEMTNEGCSAVTSALKSNPSHLRELDLSGNKLGDSGVKHLCDILKDSHCKLEILRLSDCIITEEGYKALASALRKPSHLLELDLTGNEPGQLGVKELTDLLQDLNCQLKTIRFLKSPAAEEACEYLTEVLGKSPLLLTELDLSEDKLGALDGDKFYALLMDSHCKVEKMKLNNCELTEKSCSVLANVLSSKTILKELNLNNSHLLNSGVKQICEGLKNPVCELKTLKLSDCNITEEGYKALASALTSNPSHLVELDLTGNDPGQSGVKELTDLLQDQNCQLKLRFLSPAADEAFQYVRGIVGGNPLLIKNLDLSKHKIGDTRMNQIAALLQDKHCQLNKLQLRDCGLTEESCSALATVLRSNSRLEELDISNNNLQDSGVKKLQKALENTNCTLKKLGLSDCSITEEGYKALASALRSNPSHLVELDLTGNDPGQSGVKELTDLLQDPNCQLKLRFLSPAADEACQYVKEIVGKNPLLLRELNLSERELGDTRVNQIAALLQDKHCQLNTLILCRCSITENQCLILTSALKSNPSHLRELNLRGNKLGDSGVKHLCDILKDSHCKLERLRLTYCKMSNEGCSAVTSALKSNPSHLRELDLSGNKLGDSGVKHLCDALKDSHCKLERLRFTCCEITNEGCSAVTSALKSNPSHLRELDLSGNKLVDSGVMHLCDILKDSQFKLERLRLTCCKMTNEVCSAVASALKSNPSHLRELDLSGNKLGDSGVKHLYDILKDSHCKLEILRFTCCEMTDEGCSAVTSALKSNPSHLRELDLIGNKLGDSGVENLSDLLTNTQCKLEKLHLSECSITEKQCISLTSALKSNPSYLIELDLGGNKIENTGVNQLFYILNESLCKLERLSLNNCGITDVSSLTQSLTNTKALQFLKELDLRNNNIGDSKEQLRAMLRHSNCELKLDSELNVFAVLGAAAAGGAAAGGAAGGVVGGAVGGVAAAALAAFRIFR